MKKIVVCALLALPLAACGTAAGLKPPPGKSLPVAAFGAPARPTPAELLTPSAQQRPQRSDDLLSTSENRTADPYDLPPQN